MSQDESGARMNMLAAVKNLKRRLTEHNRALAPSSASARKKQATDAKKKPNVDAVPSSTAPVQAVLPDEHVRDDGVWKQLAYPFNTWMSGIDPQDVKNIKDEDKRPNQRAKLRGNLVIIVALASTGTAVTTSGASLIGFCCAVGGGAIFIGVFKGWADEGPAAAKREALRKKFLKNFYTLPVGGAPVKAGDGGTGAGASAVVVSDGPPVLRDKRETPVEKVNAPPMVYRKNAPQREASLEKASGSPVLRLKAERSEEGKEGQTPAR